MTFIHSRLIQCFATASHISENRVILTFDRMGHSGDNYKIDEIVTKFELNVDIIHEKEDWHYMEFHQAIILRTSDRAYFRTSSITVYKDS